MGIRKTSLMKILSFSLVLIVFLMFVFSCGKKSQEEEIKKPKQETTIKEKAEKETTTTRVPQIEEEKDTLAKEDTTKMREKKKVEAQKITKKAEESNDFILVEGGTFQMGSETGEEREAPVHQVTVDSFYMAKYEVTQEEYRKLTGENPSKMKGENKPVGNVSWYDAVKYCNKLSLKEGLTPCYSGQGKAIKCDFKANGYRLPTEAEWEFAASGGVKSKNYKYAGSNNAKEVAVLINTLYPGPKDVGSKKPNELGLYDMSGNVRELCWDWYGPYTKEPKTNPTGPDSGKFRVEKGGSWKHDKYFARITARYYHEPMFNYGSVGFRLCRSKK